MGYDSPRAKARREWRLAVYTAQQMSPSERARTEFVEGTNSVLGRACHAVGAARQIRGMLFDAIQAADNAASGSERTAA